jgi:hypothetical protein
MPEVVAAEIAAPVLCKDCLYCPMRDFFVGVFEFQDFLRQIN